MINVPTEWHTAQMRMLARDSRYSTLLRDFAEPLPHAPLYPRSLPCVHEEGIHTFCPRGDESLHVRGCAVHDQCTRGPSGVRSCVTCPDYKAAQLGNAGIVLGHFGLPHLARLNIEAIHRHCGHVPILIADDGAGRDAEFDRITDEYANVTFWPSAERLGHYAGDLSVFWKGLQWAHHNKIRWLCKLSQRFIWLRPNWLEVAAETLRSSGRATMMQACTDLGVNLFVRSECMMLDVEKWLPHLSQFADLQLHNPTELRIWHLVYSHFASEYREWPGMPVNRYEQADGSLWHGSNAVQPYAELAAQYGLPLDSEFNVSGWETQENWKRG